jgi:hypothetical protein
MARLKTLTLPTLRVGRLPLVQAGAGVWRTLSVFSLLIRVHLR